jgi:AbiV family abortive infection protein
VDFPETDEISAWISIEEKLPEKRGPVLGVMKDTLEAMVNANELMKDGDLLYINERFQRSYAMYQLANEELGKALFSMVHLISDYKNYTTRIDWYTKTFYNYKPKSIASTDIDLVAVTTNKKESDC